MKVLSARGGSSTPSRREVGEAQVVRIDRGWSPKALTTTPSGSFTR
jgi:hypothetical protein